MKFIVLSWQMMEAFTYTKPYVVVSICEPGEKSPKFLSDSNRKDILTIRIHDIDDVKVAEEGGYKMMDEEQAEEILAFANHWKDKLNIFVIHCHAGVCRSAGVAAALARIFNGNSRGITDNPRFLPSTHIQATMVKVAERMKLGYYKE